MNYSCPSCGDRSPFEASCDRCARPMRAEGDPAEPERPRDFSGSLAAGTILGALHAAVFSVIVVVPWLGHLLGGWGFSLVIVLVACVVLMVLGAMMGHHAANVGAACVLDRLRGRDLTYFDAAARRELRELTPGPVRVRGFVRAFVPVSNDRGVPCVACEMIPDGVSAAAPRCASGGVFELIDREGSAVWVDARHVAVVDGVEIDGTRMVPPGAVVELWAIAARDDGGLQEHPQGYREPAQSWRLHGTAATPVVLRMP